MDLFENLSKGNQLMLCDIIEFIYYAPFRHLMSKNQIDR